MTLVALALVAYLIGSIPFAVIVSRLFGLPERVRAPTRNRVPVDVKAVEVTRPVQRRLEAPRKRRHK